ncbi:MAG: hypothetical protein MJ133_02180 [Lachnospiraceae bacterium]|nr:hypothetical protein [Lachnospiraceae bacterium]
MLHTEEYKILLPKELPEPEKTPFILSVGPAMTMMVPILLMALLAGRFYGQNSSGYMYLSLITGGTGCFFGVIWIIVNRSFKSRSYRKKLEAKNREYELYISQTDEYLNDCAKENRKYLLEHYPSAREIVKTLNEYSVWKRYRTDSDFGYVRTGIGTIPFQMKVTLDSTVNEMFPTKETLTAKELVAKYQCISKVPIGVDFLSYKYINVVPTGVELVDYEYILGLLVKISASIHYKDISIAIFYDESNKTQKNMIRAVKFLPHLFDRVTGRRYLFGSPESIRKLLPDFDNDESERTEPVIAFILDDKHIKEETIYQKMTGNAGTGNLSTVFLKQEKEMPACIQKVIRIQEEDSNERIDFKEADSYSRTLAGFLIDIGSNSEKLPAKVDILNLYNAESIADIPIEKMWKENDPCKRIKVPIGVLQNKEKIYLDVHEKFHGPHGLVAGTTGSGKSELIQSYLISLCLSFSPEDVNFFLIDYKGGGTGNHISKLRHCVGCISNLSGNRINRSLLAIASENKRRQMLFSQYGVNHIDDYMQLHRKGIAKESIPHLLLIIDEFAELKKEEPEFMKQIISLAAVGRSLGIHLVLATQKPAGVVDDKIRANTNFRLCLKVQDRQDSMDMLGRREAAYLTNPGDCYLQIGNNEFFQKFKTAYCGGKYAEGCKEREVAMIDETGEKQKTKEPVYDINSRLLTEIMVDFINDYADDIGLKGSDSLWMEELDDNISLIISDKYEAIGNKSFEGDNLVLNTNIDTKVFCGVKEYASYVNQYKYPMGLYDNPAERKQGYIFYEPIKDGNLIIGGNSGSGKTKLLCNLADVVSLHGGVILIDISAGKLMESCVVPRAMGLVKNADDMNIFFYHLKKILISKEDIKYPIFIFIDNLPGFIKMLDEERTDIFINLLNVGLSKKIYLLATLTTPGELSPKFFSKFRSSISFEMNDKFHYGDMLRSYRITAEIKKNTPGRCLYKVEDTVCECQIFENVDSISEMEEYFPKGNEHMLEINKIPVIPELITVERLFSDMNRGVQKNKKSNKDDEYEDIFLPLGYSMKSGYVRGVRLKENDTFVISTDAENALTEYMNIIEKTFELCAGIQDEGIHHYRTKTDINNVYGQPDIFECRNNTKEVILIDDISILEDFEDSEFNRQLLNIAQKRKRGILVVGMMNEVSFDISSMKLYKALSQNGQGLCIGGMLSGQRNIDFKDIGYAESSIPVPKGTGYLRIKGVEKTLVIKIPKDNREEDTDDYD